MDFSKFEYKYFETTVERIIKTPPGKYPIKEEKLLNHLKIYIIMRPEYLPIIEIEDDKLIIK